MVSRRRIVITLGAGALAPLASFGQPRKVWRIGFLWEEPSTYAARSDAFKAGMTALGYIEGDDTAGRTTLSVSDAFIYFPEEGVIRP